MLMVHKFLLFLASLICSYALAQDLGDLINNAYTFDDRFPRETVYLHLDNASYIQGDTLWYKAFVVRASTLRPDSTLSRTLYVEFLNDAGTLLQRSILRLDSVGQAYGNFALTPPLQNGFYEIRAYTRAMTNWLPDRAALHSSKEPQPQAGYFSRVFPLFEIPKKALPGDFTQLEIQHPEVEQDFKLPHERPYNFGRKKDRRIELYPEGGRLSSGTRAHVAYRLTDGTGMPTEDSISVFSADGRLLCKSAPEYEGMGTFVLPSTEDGVYVQVKDRREKHLLPHPNPTAIALHAYEGVDDESGQPIINLDLQPAKGMIVQDEDGDDVPLRVAVVVFSREVPYKVFPLELFEGITTLVVDAVDFKDGINRIEVLDAEGHPLAWRLISTQHIALECTAHESVPASTLTDAAAASVNHSEGKRAIVQVRQNAESYEAFDPIAIELELKDENGKPLPFTELSVSIRDERGDLILDEQPSLSTQLQFVGELQGYIHQPEACLRGHDASHHRALDLLMQVHGWRPETMEQLCMTDSFFVNQPMEDFPIIRGRVIKDNDRMQPYANMDLGLKMYNRFWHVLSADTKTNNEGVFAFESHEDFMDDYTTEFSVTNSNGNKVWHRVMLDQWFGPKPKKYDARELTLSQPIRPTRLASSGQNAREGQGTQTGSSSAHSASTKTNGASFDNGDDLLFQWTDTIPRTVSQHIGEVVIKHKRSFTFELVGQEFDRYVYGGGEAHSIRHSDTYFNVDLELQRVRDAGIDLFSIRNFLTYLIGDKDITLNPDPMITGGATSNVAIQHNNIERLAEQQEGGQEAPETYSAGRNNGAVDVEKMIDRENEIKNESGIPQTLNIKGLEYYVIVNNGADVPENMLNMQMPEQLKSVIVSYNAAWATQLWNKHHFGEDRHFDGVIYVHTRPDWYNYKNVKGIQKRTLHGITHPLQFKGPDYRRVDAENPEDFRRTLYWNPCLKTDAEGKATAIFFANARWRQYLRITVRGITADGRTIEYDR